MQRQIIKNIIIINMIAILNGCSISDWYNGYYAEASAIKRSNAERDAYYNSHTPEWNAAFKKNSFECNDLAYKPENRIHTAMFPKGESNQGLYIKCMREKGTAVYDGSW